MLKTEKSSKLITDKRNKPPGFPKKNMNVKYEINSKFHVTLFDRGHLRFYLHFSHSVLSYCFRTVLTEERNIIWKFRRFLMVSKHKAYGILIKTIALDLVEGVVGGKGCWSKIMPY